MIMLGRTLYYFYHANYQGVKLYKRSQNLCQFQICLKHRSRDLAHEMGLTTLDFCELSSDGFGKGCAALILYKCVDSPTFEAARCIIGWT